MEDDHIVPLVHLMDSGLEILVWEFVLLVMIHVTSVYGESLIICGMYFHWRFSIID